MLVSLSSIAVLIMCVLQSDRTPLALLSAIWQQLLGQVSAVGNSVWKVGFAFCPVNGLPCSHSSPPGVMCSKALCECT